jgi:hypothetical protein
MANCFNVGIRLCGELQEFMVDDIVGVSSQIVHALKDNDQQEFTSFFSELKNASYKAFLKDIELELLKRKKFNHIVSETKPYSGTVKSELFTNVGTIGYKVELPYHQFTEYHLKGIDLFAHRSGSIQVRVTNLVDGDLVYVEDFDLNRGRNSVKIDKKFYSSDYQYLFIGINIGTAVLDTVSCDGHPYRNNLICECECGHGIIEPCEYISCETVLKRHCKVFCLNAALRCSLENIICEHAEFFSEAYKYKLGIDILNHKLSANKCGWYISSNASDIREFTIPELKVTYYQLMNLAITNIADLLADSICWSCDGVSGLVPQDASYA